MSNAAVKGESTETQFVVRSRLGREDRTCYQKEQLERWLAEHRRHEAVEKALADVSKFSYEPEDYEGYRLKKPFIEPQRTDYSFLLAKRVRDAEQHYQNSIIIRWLMITVAIVSVAVFPSLVTAGVVAVIVSMIGISQVKVLNECKRVISQIESQTKQEIDAKNKAQEQEIAEKRKAHEKAEEDRVGFFVRLCEGDPSAMTVVLDAVVSTIAFPYPMNVKIDLFDNVMLVKAWLPDKSLIPLERTSLSESGHIKYEKKKITEINKQYAELCAATMMQLVTVIYENLPTIVRIYGLGMRNVDDKEECILSFQVDRERVAECARASTSLLALRVCSADYVCDDNLQMLSVESIYPTEWESIEKVQMRSLRVKNPGNIRMLSRSK